MDVLVITADPAEAGLPNCAVVRRVVHDVDSPGSPYYPVWEVLDQAMAPVGYSSECAGAIIGMLDALRWYASRGYSPTEYHDPRAGAYATLDAAGWLILYAPWATWVRLDSSMTIGSVTAETSQPWYDAIMSVSPYYGSMRGVGSPGAEAAPVPPFWTQLAGNAYELMSTIAPSPAPAGVRQEFVLVAGTASYASVGFGVDEGGYGSITPSTLSVGGAPYQIAYLDWYGGELYVEVADPSGAQVLIEFPDWQVTMRLGDSVMLGPGESIVDGQTYTIHITA